MRQLVNPRHKELSVRSQTELLEIPRSTLYYKPIGESPENLEIMQKMDKHHIEHPTCGVLGMQDMLVIRVPASTSSLICFGDLIL